MSGPTHVELLVVKSEIGGANVFDGAYTQRYLKGHTNAVSLIEVRDYVI